MGATPLAGGGCEFLLWAPRVEQVEVHLVSPREQFVVMERLDRGYHRVVVPGTSAGARYLYRLDGGNERPDPVSRYQPEGPHGPSQVVAPDFSWTDSAWRGLPLDELVFYELHVGTFTPEGTFDGVIPRLDELKALGITAIELMPVAQFPGSRNWGYDGTYLYAPQNSYGGPEGLKRLVNECHRRGLAVALDVVYNHLGPEGNYLRDFAPYFSASHRTPWGEAINFDDAHSDEVRHFFVGNALEWVTDYHIDALRLDAIHAILDVSAIPFLTELGEAVHQRAGELQRQIFVIPESDRNDAHFVERIERGGCGLDAQWNDDFHHALHVLITGERNGYYEDFHGTGHLARAMREGYVYQGEYSQYRRRRHGNSSREIPAERLVVFAQNHDQVGNRMLGDRLSTLVDFESLKLAAGTVLLSPFVPLLFMGEEYGEPAPFQYFVSHSDPGLIEAVRKGRREEFARFQWQGEVPDPQDETTFARCRLQWELRGQGKNAVLWELYRELLRLRRKVPALRTLDNRALTAQPIEEPPVLFLQRGVPPARPERSRRRPRRASSRPHGDGQEVFAAFHFGGSAAEVTLPAPTGRWKKLLDSADPHWQGPGSVSPGVLESHGDVMLKLTPKSFVLFGRADSPA